MTDLTRKVLAPTTLKDSNYVAPHFHVVVDNDVTLEDILRPAFWAHHASNLRRFNTIDLVRDNGTLDVTVRVIEPGQGFVKVRPIRVWEDEVVAKARAAEAESEAKDPGAIKLPDEYKITHGRGSFILTYIPTDTRIGQGYKTRDLAVTAAKEHAANAGIEWPAETETEAA